MGLPSLVAGKKRPRLNRRNDNFINAVSKAFYQRKLFNVSFGPDQRIQHDVAAATLGQEQIDLVLWTRERSSAPQC